MARGIPEHGTGTRDEERRIVDIGKIVREVEVIPEGEPDRAPLEEPQPVREPSEQPS